MPPVCLQFGFARATGTNAAAQTGQYLSASGQPRQQITQLRQLHLQFAFFRSGIRSKNVKDQHGPVHYPDICTLFQISYLSWCQFSIKNQQFNPIFGTESRNLFHHACAHTGGRIRCRPFLGYCTKRFSTCTAHQFIEFRQRSFRIIFSSIALHQQRPRQVFCILIHSCSLHLSFFCFFRQTLFYCNPSVFAINGKQYSHNFCRTGLTENIHSCLRYHFLHETLDRFEVSARCPKVLLR